LQHIRSLPDRPCGRQPVVGYDPPRAALTITTEFADDETLMTIPLNSKHGLVAGLVLALAAAAQTGTLIHGTIFLSPDIITEDDPSALESIEPAGLEVRNMYDRRVREMVDAEAWLFDVVWNDGLCSQFVVNAEHGELEDAQALVEQYAPAVGRLPGYLRRSLVHVWLQPGDHVFAGGSDALLIHTGAVAEGYIADGILEETLAHEAAHASLDPLLSESEAWLDAQAADGAFISDYAQEHPAREDVAETVVPWIAVCCGESRVDTDTEAAIRRLAGNRLAVLEKVLGELSEQHGYGGQAACSPESEAGE
jgi:hypothetical protein